MSNTRTLESKTEFAQPSDEEIIRVVNEMLKQLAPDYSDKDAALEDYFSKLTRPLTEEVITSIRYTPKEGVSFNLIEMCMIATPKMFEDIVRLTPVELLDAAILKKREGNFESLLHEIFTLQTCENMAKGIVALLEKASQSAIDKVYGMRVDGATLLEAALIGRKKGICDEKAICALIRKPSDEVRNAVARTRTTLPGDFNHLELVVTAGHRNLHSKRVIDTFMCSLDQSTIHDLFLPKSLEHNSALEMSYLDVSGKALFALNSCSNRAAVDVLQYVNARTVREWYKCVRDVESDVLKGIANYNAVLFNEIIKKLLSVNFLPNLTSFTICHLSLENMRDLFIRFPTQSKEDLKVSQKFVATDQKIISATNQRLDDAFLAAQKEIQFLQASFLCLDEHCIRDLNLLVLNYLAPDGVIDRTIKPMIRAALFYPKMGVQEVKEQVPLADATFSTKPA